MRKELAQIVGKIVFDWCNGETDLEQNGYTLAKEFDDKGYSPDTMFYPETLQYGVRTPDQSETAHYIVNSEKVTRAVGDLV